MATCSIVKCKIAIVAAMEREVSALVKNRRRVQRPHEGRTYTLFESADSVCVCGGIGVEAARRAAEAVIALYRPQVIYSVGFAGALDSTLHVGDIFTPSAVVDARDGSRVQLEEGSGTLLTFPQIASAAQKLKLATSYTAQAVDMEAAAVAAAASKHGIPIAAAKAISDEAHFEISATQRFIDPESRFHTTKFVLFALLRPWLWPRMAKLAANSQKAAKALARHLERIMNNQPSELPETAFPARRHN
jgi:adenosylhomocysteine nucleosidase